MSFFRFVFLFYFPLSWQPVACRVTVYHWEANLVPSLYFPFPFFVYFSLTELSVRLQVVCPLSYLMLVALDLHTSFQDRISCWCYFFFLFCLHWCFRQPAWLGYHLFLVYCLDSIQRRIKPVFSFSTVILIHHTYTHTYIHTPPFIFPCCISWMGEN